MRVLLCLDSYYNFNYAYVVRFECKSNSNRGINKVLREFMRCSRKHKNIAVFFSFLNSASTKLNYRKQLNFSKDEGDIEDYLEQN
jgi:hypothetical protein